MKLVNMFDQVNDIRYSTFFRTVGTRVLIAKYGVVVAGNGENFLYDIKMLRTSEMVLSRAEAYAELNNLVAANNDLALLRSNRILNYVHVPINDKAALVGSAAWLIQVSA